MQVPVIKAQTVGVTQLPTGYADVTVTPLSQGAGVGTGLSSLGGDLADAAIRAKRQADLTAINNAVATTTAEGDRLSEGYDQLDGMAKAGAADKTIAAYGNTISEVRGKLTPDQQVDYDAWAQRSHEAFRHSVTIDGAAAAYKAGFDSVGIRVQSNNVAASRKASRGDVKYSQTPSIPDAAQGSQIMAGGTGTEAPGFFTGNTDALLQDSLDAHKAWADAHEGRLYINGMPVDKETYIRLSGEITKSDHYQAVLDGMVAPQLGAPIDDRALAAYFKAHRGDIDPEDAKRLDAKIETISDAANSQRIAANAWASHVGEGGTWSERQAAMEKDAKGNSGALKIIDSSVEGARTRETQSYSDQTNAILEGVDKGDSATTATQRAAGLPVAYKEAVAKALYNRDNKVVIEKQNNEYQKWSTMAAGVDPATGKPDPKMRDAFIAQDFTTEYGQMTEPDRNELMSFQKELKAGGGEKTTSLVSDDEIAQHVINTIAPDDKGTVREEKLYRMKRQLDALFEAERGDGPPLKPAQKQKIAEEVLAQSVFDKWGFGTGNITIYEALTTPAEKLDVSDIPDPIRESITSQLKAGGIADPSDEDIIRAYQKQLGVGLLNVID